MPKLAASGVLAQGEKPRTPCPHVFVAQTKARRSLNETSNASHIHSRRHVAVADSFITSPKVDGRPNRDFGTTVSKNTVKNVSRRGFQTYKLRRRPRSHLN